MKIKLSKRLARNGKADEYDVKQVKKALNRTGHYQPYEKTGITGMPDAAMFAALKSFQKEQGLRPTGTVMPGDETESALNAAAAKTPAGQYIWRTVEDEKVRSSHAELNRTVRSWGDSPDPGEEYNCRCWAEPVKSEAEGLKQEVTSVVKDASQKWDTLEFGLHFINGNGREVTLSEIGHLGGIIDKAREIMFKNVEDQVAEKMRQIESGSLIYTTENSYDQLNEVHWVLGGGTIQTKTVGVVKQDGNVLTLEGWVEYLYFDEVTDPINIRELYRGHHQVADLPDSFLGGAELRATDLFLGKAYPITGNWKTRITGSISIKE